MFGWSFSVGGGSVRVGSSVESVKIKPNCRREGGGRESREREEVEEVI